MKRDIKVAICGELPTAYNLLLTNGVVQIERFMDATEIPNEEKYNMILIYAPHADGLFNVKYSVLGNYNIPVLLLSEPCSKAALDHLQTVIEHIDVNLSKAEVIRCG
ncbi:MAG: hypothetical protein IJY39_11470 [Clostridia bacterium]|nr:hypothetical protein [Clostridia bacterium]